MKESLRGLKWFQKERLKSVGKRFRLLNLTKSLKQDLKTKLPFWTHHSKRQNTTMEIKNV